MQSVRKDVQVQINLFRKGLSKEFPIKWKVVGVSETSSFWLQPFLEKGWKSCPRRFIVFVNLKNLHVAPPLACAPKGCRSRKALVSGALALYSF
jgi:hypothetical protein